MPQDFEAQLAAASMLLAAGQFRDAETRVKQGLLLEPENVDAHIVLGNALAGLRDLDGAVAQLTEAIQINPKRARSYSNLGSLRALQGDRDKAEASFLKAVEVGPDDVDAHLALANYFWSSGRIADAENVINAALAIDRTHELANRALATLYITTNRIALAEPSLRLLAEHNPESVAMQLQLATYYASVGRLNDARRSLSLLAERRGAWGPASAVLATVEYADGNEETGHGLIDEVIAQEPGNLRARLVKACFLMSEANYDAALTLLSGAVAAAPNHPSIHYAIASIHAQQHRYEEAIESYRKVLRLNPSIKVAQLELSRLLLLVGDAPASVDLAEAAVAADHTSLVARVTLSRSLMATGELERAETLLVSLLRESPRSAALHAQYGTLLLGREDTPAAKRAFDQALELDDGSLEALRGRLTIDSRAGRHGSARLEIEQRLATDPDNVELLMLAAGVYEAAGNPLDAERALRSVLQIDTARLDGYTSLGRLYLKQGRLDEALTEFERLAARQPTQTVALTMVAMILEARGRIADAIRRYEHVLERDPSAAVAANNLAWHYASGGVNLTRALELAQIAKQQLPNRHEVSHTLGWAYYKMALPARERFRTWKRLYSGIRTTRPTTTTSEWRMSRRATRGPEKRR